MKRPNSKHPKKMQVEAAVYFLSFIIVFDNMFFSLFKYKLQESHNLAGLYFIEVKGTQLDVVGNH